MSHVVFISYANSNKTVADAVCARLEQRRLRCWVAPRDILPGASWPAAILDAIKNAQIMVVIVSGESNASQFVAKEVGHAVERGIPVIPIRIENVVPSEDLGYFLGGKHWLDAINPPLEAHLEKLGNAIDFLLGLRQPPPIDTPIKSTEVMRAEQGTAGWGWDGNPYTKRSFRITFAKPFNSAPIIQTSIVMLDSWLEKENSVRIWCHTLNIDCKGADIEVGTWEKNTINGMKIQWTAMGD